MNTLAIVNDINAALKNKVNLKHRRAATEAYLAELMAYRHALPSGAVGNPNNYFLTHVKVPLMAELAKVNEHIVFDLDACCDLTYRLWKARYQIAYRPELPSTPRLLDIAVQSGMVNQAHADVRAVYADYIVPPRSELKGEVECTE